MKNLFTKFFSLKTRISLVMLLLVCGITNGLIAQGNYTTLTRGLPVAIIPSPVSPAPTPVSQGDDFGVVVPFGFTFNFYGTAYTSLILSSNGYLAFGSNPGSYGQTLPSNNANNVIAFAWADLFIDASATVNYFTSGTAPNRVLVINYRNVRHYSGEVGNNIDVQLQLSEGSNAIEIHNVQNRSTGVPHTLGIQGTTAQFLTQSSLNGVAFAGVNAIINEMIRFTACTTPLSETAVISTSTNTVCVGNTVTLSATGCSGTQLYKWSNGATGSSIVATPTAPSTSYSAKCFDGVSGCLSATNSNLQTIAVNGATPVISTSTTGACGSQTLTMTTQSGLTGTFQWKLNGTNISGATASSYSSAVVGSYTVEYTIGVCITLSNPYIFSQNAAPTIALTTPNASNCNSTLTATGCSGTVNWERNYGSFWSSEGSGNPYTFPVTTNPPEYRATCFSNGCTSLPSNVVKAIPNNFTQINFSSAVLCPSGSVLLNASSAFTGLTYQWQRNFSNISGATASSYSATLGGTYTLITSLGFCNFTSASVSINAVSAPTLSITSTLTSPASITNGQSLTLTANGCGGTILWSNSATTPSITVTPSSSTTYTFTCTLSSCTFPPSSGFIVNVNPLLPPTLSSSAVSTCTGSSVTLTATACAGGGIVTWSTSQTGLVISVSPSISTSYTATCTVGSVTSANSLPLAISVFNGVITSLASGNWNTPATWSCNCIPAACNDVIVDTGHVVTIPVTQKGRLQNLTLRGTVDVKTTGTMALK